MRSDANAAKKMSFFPFPVVLATECSSPLLVPPGGTSGGSKQTAPVTTTTWPSLLHAVIHLLITSHGPDTVLERLLEKHLFFKITQNAFDELGWLCIFYN